VKANGSIPIIFGLKPLVRTIHNTDKSAFEINGILAGLRKGEILNLKSKEGEFFNYLKRILLENEIILDGDCVKISHVNFPRRMTEKQFDAVRERIGSEISLYALGTEVAFVQFPILQKVDEKIGIPGSKRAALFHQEVES
jgi:hypothetical protein